MSIENIVSINFKLKSCIKWGIEPNIRKKIERENELVDKYRKMFSAIAIFIHFECGIFSMGSEKTLFRLGVLFHFCCVARDGNVVNSARGVSVCSRDASKYTLKTSRS